MLRLKTLPLKKRSAAPAKITTPGGNKQVKWEIVARTPGLTPALIIAGRLQAEGIPARAWQEGAGQALGLMVGILGNGHVIVPKDFAEKAQEILAEAPADFSEE